YTIPSRRIRNAEIGQSHCGRRVLKKPCAIAPALVVLRQYGGFPDCVPGQPHQGGALPPGPQLHPTAGITTGDERFIVAALKDLRSGKRDHQVAALSTVQGLWGQRGEVPAELRAEIAKLTEVDESFLAGMAVRTLGIVGGAGELPALEKALARAKE